MRYAELLSLYFERSTALQNYWTLYVVVIGGLLAVTAIRREPDVPAGLLVTILFCMFAYKNLDAIHDASVNRFAILTSIHHFSDEPVSRDTREPIEASLNPPVFDGVRNFHIASDALTIVTLWTLQVRRLIRSRRAAAAVAGKGML